MAHRLVMGLFVIACVAGCQQATATFTATVGSAETLSPRAKGAKEASDAIAAGQLKWKEYPPPPSPAWYGNYIRLLKERCNVDYEVPSLPKGMSEADFIEEIRGWNDTMTVEIKKRFGDNILQQLHEEAEAQWRKKKA